MELRKGSVLLVILHLRRNLLIVDTGTLNKNTTRSTSQSLDTKDDDLLSLVDIRVKGTIISVFAWSEWNPGYLSESNANHESALAPPFVWNRLLYTVMIPHDLEEIRLMLLNQGQPEVSSCAGNAYWNVSLGCSGVRSKLSGG